MEHEESRRDDREEERVEENERTEDLEAKDLQKVAGDLAAIPTRGWKHVPVQSEG